MTNTGKRHRRIGEACQDAACVDRGGRFIAAAVADGVSSCREAKKGAEIVSAAAVEVLLHHAERLFQNDTETVRGTVMKYVRYRLKMEAEANQAAVEDYGCTLVCVLIDLNQKRMLYLSTGDSGIITLGESTVWTENREIYAMDPNKPIVTVATDEDFSATNCRVVDLWCVQQVILCSDGFWRPLAAEKGLTETAEKLLLQKDDQATAAFFEKTDPEDDYTWVTIDLSRAE